MLGSDGDKLRQFHGGLFGWTFDANNPIKYGMVDTGEKRGIPWWRGSACLTDDVRYRDGNDNRLF